MRVWLAILAVLLLSVTASAQSIPDYSDEVEEQARRVGKQLRCVVCQNESIEESDAELAADMRLVVREQLAAGDSEADVIARMRDRYGDYVLLKPPLQGNTLILWLAPVGLVGLFFGWWILSLRRDPDTNANTVLTDEDYERLAQLRKERS